jgi:hypothetical protein
MSCSKTHPLPKVNGVQAICGCEDGRVAHLDSKTRVVPKLRMAKRNTVRRR